MTRVLRATMAAIQPHMMDCLVNIQTPAEGCSAPSSLWSNSNTHLAHLHSGSPVTYKTSGGRFNSQTTDQCDQFIQDQFTCIRKENQMCDSLTLTTGRKKSGFWTRFFPLNALQIQTVLQGPWMTISTALRLSKCQGRDLETKKSYLGHGYECIYIYIL